MIFLNFDLAGAEWVVVAYVSGDQNMIGVVEAGKSPHVVTGALISGAPEELVQLEHKKVGDTTDPDEIARLRGQLPTDYDWGTYFLPRSMSIRKAGKKSNHGLNYDMRFRRFALENEIPETEAKPIVHAYNNIAYPQLPEWRERVKSQLRHGRTLVNCLGRKVRLLDQWGPELFDKAYSFVPQSTVVDIANRAMRLAYEDTRPEFELADLLGQKHDSLLFQFPETRLTEMADFCIGMYDMMRPELEWEGRSFRLGVDLKIGYTLGTMAEKPLSSDRDKMLEILKESHAELASSVPMGQPAAGYEVAEPRLANAG